jgi:methylated-DNA-protein-cysteine methyltransferase related protein
MALVATQFVLLQHRLTFFSMSRHSTNALRTNEGMAMSWDPVYLLVKQIPRGRVLSYGALARALRLPGGARSAGRAMAATPSGKGIPWHRVVGERGKILIREPYASLQKKLLESEGIKILESRVDLKHHLWTPPRKSASKKRTPKVNSPAR